jgi:tetratricopeptide (TPR) repeat protein
MARHPTNVALCARGQYYIASQYYANRDHQRAIQEYRKLVTSYPSAWLECQKAQFELGQISLYRLDNPQQAISEYEHALQDYPRSFVTALAQLGLGRAYRRLGEAERATQAYHTLVTTLPEYAHEVTEAYLDLGHLSITQALTPGAASSTKDMVLREAISTYKQAYLACPLETVDLMTQCLDNVYRTFRSLDGSFVRANAWVKYLKYGQAGLDGRLETADDLTDPLQGF